MKITLTIITLFLKSLTSFGFGNGQPDLQTCATFINCDTAKSHMDSLRERVLIDTTLHFNNVKEIANYKHKKDSLYTALIANNSKIGAQRKEKIGFDNSIRFARLFYKYLIECDKGTKENFDFFGFIAHDYGLFSREQMLSLYNLFPEKFKNSKEGKTYLATINARPDNIGHSILGAGNISFESAGGESITLQKLIDGNHSFYIILFTASWCGPCRYYTNVFRNDLEKMDKDQVKVISISIDKSRSQWLQYLKDEKYTWSNYRTMKGWDSTIMSYLHLESIPHYLLLDKKGIIIDEQSGYGMKQIINRIKQRK
jgi:thiol-disulfide isomerase/thioredoxin